MKGERCERGEVRKRRGAKGDSKKPRRETHVAYAVTVVVVNVLAEPVVGDAVKNVRIGG